MGNGNKQGGEKEKTCTPEFLSKRRADTWYPANHFGPAAGCTAKTKTVPETVAIPVYWLIGGDDWKDTDVQPRLDEAKTWFEKYCIKVPFYEVALTAQESAKAKKALTAALTDRDKFRAEVEALFEAAWKTRLHSPDKSLLLLFVDQFAEIKYYLKSNAINSVSGNFWEIPAILLRSNDKGASHIVTHELIHGLGKPITKDRSSGFDAGNEDNTWNHGGCKEDMGNAKRPGGAGGVFNNPTSDLMDWASYWQMTVDVKNVT